MGIPAQVGLIQDGSSGKLDVLAEVEDEDFHSSSPATNSPQCTSTEIISATDTTHVSQRTFDHHTRAQSHSDPFLCLCHQ